MWMGGERRREEQRGEGGHRVRWTERPQTPRSQRLGSARPKLGTLSKSIPGAPNSWTLGMERTILIAAPQCTHMQAHSETRTHWRGGAASVSPEPQVLQKPP